MCFFILFFSCFLSPPLPSERVWNLKSLFVVKNKERKRKAKWNLCDKNGISFEYLLKVLVNWTAFFSRKNALPTFTRRIKLLLGLFTFDKTCVPTVHGVSLFNRVWWWTQTVFIWFYNAEINLIFKSIVESAIFAWIFLFIIMKRLQHFALFARFES